MCEDNGSELEMSECIGCTRPTCYSCAIKSLKSAGVITDSDKKDEKRKEEEDGS